MSQQVTLTINSPAGTQQATLGEGSLTFGRTDASSFPLPGDTGLSRRHATVYNQGGRVWVVDENSTNGSFVHGTLVPPGGLALNDGDKIKIGNSTVIKVSIRREAAIANQPIAGQPNAQAVQTQAAPAAAQSSSLPPQVLVAAVAVVVLLLGVTGFLLYRATRPSEVKVASNKLTDGDSSVATDTSTDTTATTKSDGDANADSVAPSEQAPTPVPVVKVREDVSILSSKSPAADDTAEDTAPPAQVKLYQKMSEDEQMEFIKQRAEHIAMMMGRRPYAFTPDALKHIKFWLDAFARRAGNHRTGLWGGDTVSILERGKVHAPTIIRAFRQYNVPVVVGLYIPFIETEYTNISTNNFAGAAGLFQFLGPTAEYYGVPSSERTNVAKMAPAAARYFRDNIISFGDDPMSVALSIAGYNRAPESVKRDLRNVLNAPNNADKERSFWTLIANQGKLDEHFQKENINYVPRFFAAAIFGETPWAFGINMRPLSTYTEGGDEATDEAAAGAQPTPPKTATQSH
jgi:pSer/pThr/pTyr-binding forkhead associated (FHA) protein